MRAFVSVLCLNLAFWPAHALGQASGSGGAPCNFSDHWVQMESGGSHTAANANSTAIGRWQMTQAAFADTGLIRQTSAVRADHFGGGDWDNVVFQDNPFGIRNVQELRNNPAAQDYYGRIYHQRNWESAQRQGLVRDFVGQTVDVGGRRIAMNESALLTCMGYLGAGDCGRMLRGQPMSNPGHVSHALWRMSRASACDASEFSGQNTPVDAEANMAATADGQYCDPKVFERLELMASHNVNAVTALAAHPLVGYRTAEGESPLGVIGVDPTQDDWYEILVNGRPRSFRVRSGVSTRGFTGMSCLDRLLGGGIGIIFSPPSLPNILAMLESYVCRQIEQMYARAVTPLNQSFFRDFGVGGISVPIGVGVHSTSSPGVRVNSANVVSWGRNNGAWDMASGSFGPDPRLMLQQQRTGGIFAR